MSSELSVCGRRWQYSGAVKEGKAAVFAEKVLQQRGVAGADIERFLNPTLKDLMPDPGLIPDIVYAADRLMQAIVGAEDITFLADFDVDGASSAALLFQYCTFFGLRPLVEVPERLIEGFGPNRRILDAVAARGGGLMLCLDCGTAAVDLFDEYAERLHVIIVDHHRPGAVLPPVYAVVNPMCSEQGRQAFGDLAAVGVVFMLLVVTNQHLKAAGHAVPDLKGLLDLVLLGTVCDMVPMRGLNRAFVHRGLERLNTAPRVGVAALMQVSGVKPMLARPEDISFSMGPKLNAGSRQGFSSLPWQLLVQEDPDQACLLARRLAQLNMQRKQESLSLAAAAQEVMQQREGFVLASEQHWPLGILGILAGRISRRLHQPCFIISYNTDGEGSGSARSVLGIDLAELLQGAVAEGVLQRGGGHAMAGGFRLHRTQEADFIAFLEGRITAISQEIPAVVVDGRLRLVDCRSGLLAELQRLEPFGVGNPEPIFHLQDVRLRKVALMGIEHLRAEIIGADYGVLSAVLFNEAQSPLGRFLQTHSTDLELLIRLKPDFRRAGKVVAHIEDAKHPGL